MKKFVAILLAVLTVLSATSMMAFAGTDGETTEKPFECTLCDATFATQKELDDHYASTFPIDTHKKECEYGCGTIFDNIKAYESHLKYCTKKPAEKKEDADAAKTYVCDFCGEKFATNDALKVHLNDRLGVGSHVQACDNRAAGCGETFHTKAAYEAHMLVCPFNYLACGNAIDVDGNGSTKDACDKVCTFTTSDANKLAEHKKNCDCVDKRSDAKKMLDYFKNGNILGGLKMLVKIIVDFIKSDDFKKIVDKVGELVKKINFDKVVSTVKDAVSKLPVDKVADLIKK